MLSDDISVVSIISVSTYNTPYKFPQGIILAYNYLNISAINVDHRMHQYDLYLGKYWLTQSIDSRL